jgi:F-type H+-transporting ATPase subunit b
MDSIFLIAGIGQDLANVATDVGKTFGFKTSLLISQMVSFGIVAALLNKFAYKPILAVLAARRQTIAESLENAEQIKEELAKAEEARKEIIQKANDQAVQMIQEAKDAASRVLEKESQKAVVAAEQIISQARSATASDREKMLTELKKEVGRLVVQTTAIVAGKALTEEAQKELVDAATRELAA